VRVPTHIVAYLLPHTQGWSEPINQKSDWAFAGLAFVLTSDEWTRPGGCKDDSFTFMFNGKTFLTLKYRLPTDPTDTAAPAATASAAKSVSMCIIKSLRQNFSNWRDHCYYLCEPGTYCCPPVDNKHATWLGAPSDTLEYYAEYTRNKKGDRCDFVIRLQDSGDGKYPTVAYLGANSVENENSI
jgi:hypothetical protein